MTTKEARYQIIKSEMRRDCPEYAAFVRCKVCGEYHEGECTNEHGEDANNATE